MAAKRRRTSRDTRRRELGQNVLADRREIHRIIEAVRVEPGELVVEIGAGRGELTIPLARTGARVIAVEVDPVWATRLRERVVGLDLEVEVHREDLRSMRFPAEPHRVISNPPFGLTTLYVTSYSTILRTGRGGPICSCSTKWRESAPPFPPPPCDQLRGRRGGSSNWVTLSPRRPSDRSPQWTRRSSASAVETLQYCPRGWHPNFETCCVRAGTHPRFDEVDLGNNNPASRDDLDR